MYSPVVLGLDFGGTKIALATCDADGNRLGSATIGTLADDGAAASLGRAVAAARELLDATAPGRTLAAIGVSTLGIPGDDGVALAPAIPGWSDLALAREFRQSFPGAEVRVTTDVKAAAGIEAASGALAGCDPGIYLNLGTGLAVAIVANGAVVNGRNGASGEIGYNLRRVGDVGAAPADRVPLEEIVSGKALMEKAAGLLPGVADPAEVFARAGDDPRIAGLLGDFVAELAFHLVNLAIAIDPVRIAVGGGMVRSWDALHDGLRRALDAAVPYPPELVRAAYPFDAPLMGAIALGVDSLKAQQARQAGPASPEVQQETQQETQQEQAQQESEEESAPPIHHSSPLSSATA